MNPKNPIYSKTLWVNVLSVIAMVAQGITGKQILPIEYQGTALAVINIVLRLVTKQSIIWS